MNNGVDQSAEWSADEVRQFAGKAYAAGQKLAGAAGWSGTGATQTLLWGDFQGSGRTPYRVQVNLVGPTYKCSCPSRQFPCKHVVGLLLRWCGGGVDASSEAPVGVVEASAAPKAPREVSEKAIAAREHGVGEGLEQLQRWIDDQIRNGIAGISADPYAGWSEPIAKRMIDAKAPGLARWLRSLPGHLAHDEWPRLIIEDLGLIRLLIDAYRTIDALPDETAAAVRRHIGFTVPRAEVLASDPIDDTWQVLGYAETLEDRYTTRRMWLSGTATGLLVNVQSTAPSGSSFDNRLTPGREFAGGVHLYPGGPSSFRVAIPDGDVPTEPIARLAVAGTGIDSALAGRARALTVDPWLLRYPAVIAARPVQLSRPRRRYLVDADGCALPAICDDARWARLLAGSGGRLVPLLAEITTEGIDPLSMLSDTPPSRLTGPAVTAL
ncbi:MULTISPECIES: SWIM zinc finger family protein [unclassified Mycobacterium]|uniref:SWIM zinc finger family protein n=1 Tax=unclassified Mycobacterium TaxID=2642494 RepID=UPI00048B102C|nr:MULTISPECIES: SWIM zinc finger family protein [unclassified Mycobacterium]SEA30681.1 SWIM zinc finger [Mycobacterium sp. 283mftsu]